MSLDRQQDLPILRDAFYEALKRHGSSGSFGGGATGSQSSGGTSAAPAASSGGGLDVMGKAAGKALGEVTDVAKAMGGTFFDISGKFITGGVKIADVTGTLAKNLENSGGAFAGALGMGVKGVTTLVEYVSEGVDTFKELSKSGAAFNNDVVEMRVSAANTRLTLGEYAEVIKNNTTDFATLGGSVAKGAAAFTNLSKSFFDSGVSDNLRNMGYTAKDLNEILAIQAVSSRDRDAKNKKSVAEQVEAAGRLATEMDAVAKLTGKSRKEQEDMLRKQQENGQLRAAIDLAISNGGKGVGEAYKQMSTAAQVGGKDFERLQEQIFAMGRPSEDMAEKFALAGGAAQKLMYDAAAAAKKGDEATAKRLTQEAAIAYANQQNSQTNRQLAAQGHQAAMEMNANSRALSDNLAEVAKKEGLNLNIAEDRAKALEMVNSSIRAEQNAREGATSTVINAEARAADVTAALNNQLVKPLKDSIQPELLKFAKTLQDLNSGPGGFRGKTEDALVKGKKAIADELDKIDSTDKNKKENVEALKSGLKDNTTPVEGKREAGLKELTKMLKDSNTEQAALYNKRLEEYAQSQNKTKDQLLKDVGSGKADVTKVVEALKGPTTKIPGAESSGVPIDKINERGGKTPDIGENISKLIAQSLTVTGDIIGLDKAIADSFLKNIPRKAGGGFVDGPEINLIGEEGPEWVLNKEQMAATLEGAAMRGQEQISKLLPPPDLDTKEDRFKAAYESMKGMGPTGGIDMSSIAKDISTTISSVSGGGASTVKGPDMSELSRPFEKSFAEFNDIFGDLVTNTTEDIADALPISKAQAAQARIDAAIAAKEEAYEKLQKLWNEGSDDELNANHEQYAEELKAAKENLSKIIEESMGDLTETFDDFGSDWSSTLEGAFDDISSTAEIGDIETPKSTGVDIGNMNFGPNGLPIFSQIKSNASSIPNAVNPATTPAAEAEKAAAKATAQQSGKPKDQDKPSSTTKKNATLDDVVSSLEHLNKTMNQLLSTSESLGKQQVQATKSNAKNLYER